jgi:hypothetical protein
VAFFSSTAGAGGGVMLGHPMDRADRHSHRRATNKSTSRATASRAIKAKSISSPKISYEKRFSSISFGGSGESLNNLFVKIASMLDFPVAEFVALTVPAAASKLSIILANDEGCVGLFNVGNAIVVFVTISRGYAVGIEGDIGRKPFVDLVSGSLFKQLLHQGCERKSAPWHHLAKVCFDI